MSIATIEPGFAGILREDNRFVSPDVTPENATANDRINGWFDRLMVQSGVGLHPLALLLLCVATAVLIGGLLFLFTDNALLAGVGLAFGLFLPIGLAMWARSRRQAKIIDQLPNTIDELSRAARAGRSIDQCLGIVAHDTPAPLGDELKLATSRIKMGMPVGEALDDLPERTGVMSLSLLSTALSVHAQTGGDLVSVLRRLSMTLRDRTQFIGRLRTATAASRWTAIFLVLVPIIPVVVYLWRDPNYLSRLLNSTWGFWLTLLAVILQIVGAVIVFAVMSSSRKT